MLLTAAAELRVRVARMEKLAARSISAGFRVNLVTMAVAMVIRTVDAYKRNLFRSTI